MVMGQLALPQKYSLRRPMFGAVVVDMSEANRQDLAHAALGVDEAIRRTAQVISSVRECGRPVILITHERTPLVLREIAEAAGTGARHFSKSLHSAFTVPAFRRFLSETLTDALVVCGWMKGICVRETMLDGIWDGYRIMTSDDLLFDRAGVRPMEALLDYERMTHAPAVSYFENSYALVSFLHSTPSWRSGS